MSIKPNLKILIVEDDLDSRNFMKTLLRNHGLKNQESATDGNEAYEMMVKALDKDDPFELILVDWGMPKLDGLTLLNMIRNHHVFNHLPIIMVTAYAEAKHVQQAIDSGVNDYILKPINVNIVMEKIINLMDR